MRCINRELKERYSGHDECTCAQIKFRQFSFVRPQDADSSASGLEDGGVVSMPDIALKLFVKSGMRKVGGFASDPSATVNET